MAYVGGKRLRLIKDNFQKMIEDSLDQLDWFNTARKHMPVQVIGTQIDNSMEIKPNVVNISAEDLVTDSWEVGSNLEENRWSLFIDVYAENEDVGLHLAGDLLDIVRGKMPSIGRTGPNFEVLDLSQATPTSLFFCEIENIDVGRSRDWTKPFNRYWWTIGLDLFDYYMDEDD